MAIVKAKPTSPGRRGVVQVKHPHLHKGAPHAALVEKKSKSGVVTTTGFGFFLQQPRMRPTFMQVRMLDLNDTSASWRCWFCLNNCHDYLSLN